MKRKTKKKQELRIKLDNFIGDLRVLEQKRKETAEGITDLKSKLENVTIELNKLPDLSSYSIQIEK